MTYIASKNIVKLTLVRVVCSVVALACSALAYSHHSASQYDFAQNVEVTGKIIHVDISNPHIDLVLEVTNDDGSTKQIQFEGHSRNNVYRRGWRPDMMDDGDTVSIFIAPMRNGEDGGYIQGFTLENGTKF